MVDVVLRGGRSFKCLGAYLMEGSRGKPRPAHALGEILYLHLPVVRGPRHAFGIMAATARDADALKQLAGIPPGGRAGEKPVYHFILSWSREERVTEEQVREAVEEALLELGLDDRQAVVVLHRDTNYRHVHVMVNRVSPLDGRFAGMGRDRLKLSRWAKQWEQRTFGRTFCRRPERDEHLRVVRSTYNQPGKYPIRHRKRRHPVRDEHWREEWRRLLSRQRTELASARKAGGDVAALEKEQKTERARLSLKLHRMEEARRPGDANQVDPDETATAAKSEDDHAPDTADAGKVQPEQRAPANNVSELVEQPPEPGASRVPPGPADGTPPVLIPEPAHVPAVKPVEAAEIPQENKVGGDMSALENEQATDCVELVDELSRTEGQRPEDANRVAPERATTGTTSGHDGMPDTTAGANAQATGKPAPVDSVSEEPAHPLGSEASKTPSGWTDETRHVPSPEPVHALGVERIEAANVEPPNASTADKAPVPQAAHHRTAGRTSEPAGPIRTPAKSLDRDARRGRSGGSVDPRDRQESRSASPVAPPQEAFRSDSRASRTPAEQPRAKEQRPAADVTRSPDERACGGVKRMHDRPVEGAGRATKKESASISKAAGPVRDDGAATTASRIRTGVTVPPRVADETRAAPIAAPVQARAARGGTAAGTGQTAAPAAGAAPARQGVQCRTPRGAESADSHPPPARPPDAVLPDDKPGRIAAGGHRPQSASTSPKATAATSATTRSDPVQPTQVRFDYGREPALGVAMVAAAAGIRLARQSAGRRQYDTGSSDSIVDVPTMPTPAAQHAIDLAACALAAPPLGKLDQKQHTIATGAVAQELADRLGTRGTFDAGRKQLKKWPPPPASATLRDVVRQAVEWFVQRLRQFFEKHPAGTFAARAAPMTMTRNHPGRTRSGVTTPRATGGPARKSGAESPKPGRAAIRTPTAVAPARPAARSTDDSVPGTSRRAGDRRNPASTSRPTTPPATPTPPREAPDRVRQVREVQVPSRGHLPPDGDRLEHAAGEKARPGTSQATDSVQAAQPALSGRRVSSVRGSSGRSVMQMIAHQLAQKIEAERRSRYGETPAVPSGIWKSVREAAGDDEDKTTVIDALIERANNIGNGRERDRAEQHYLGHLPEVARARTQSAKREPEPSSWSLSSWFGPKPEPPVTTEPTPDPTAVLDEARQRHVQELLAIVSTLVRGLRKPLEESQEPSAETSRYRDEPWRRGHEPASGHDRNQRRGRW